MMPEMDGYETCRRLKDDAATIHIPVVMVTALGEPGERLRGLEAGADDFLTKPVEYDTLLARVQSLVRLKRLLDEWRLRGETARALGLTADRWPRPRSPAPARWWWTTGTSARRRCRTRCRARASCPAAPPREAEALALTAAIPFDLVVLSLSMTAEDPLRLASRLRATDATQDIPLLLIAEPEQKDRILRGFDLGANDWLLRPIDENELRARARNQIRRKFYQDRLRADLGSALEMALTDPLTGFYNQRYLMRHLRGLMASRADRRHRGDDDRRRPFQDHQRPLRPSGRRPGAEGGGRHAARPHPRVRQHRPLWRRGIRGGDARHRRRRTRMAAAERLRSAVEDMEFIPEPGRDAPADGQHRRGVQRRPQTTRRVAAAGRRPGDVPGQARRPQPGGTGRPR